MFNYSKKSSQGVKLGTKLHPVQKLKMWGFIYPLFRKFYDVAFVKHMDTLTIALFPRVQCEKE